MHVILIHDRESGYGTGDVVSVIVTDNASLTFKTIEQAWLHLPSDATLDNLYEALASAGYTFDVCDGWAQVEHAYLSGV